MQPEPISNNRDMMKQLFLKSLLSTVLSTTAALLGMIIDGVVISRFLGTDAMSAYGIVSPLFVLFSAISGIISTGTQTVCAKALGKGDTAYADKSFSAGIVSSIVISLVLIGIILPAKESIAIFLGASGSAAHLAGDVTAYMLGLVFVIPFLCLSSVLNSIMLVEGNRKLAVISTYAMCAVDIAGDLLCALVFHGGMLGMAVATAIGYAVSTLVLLSHYKQEHILKFKFGRTTLSTLPEIITVGLPTAVNRASNMLRSVVLNRLLIEIAASAAVAAFSVRTNLNYLYSSVSFGMGVSVLVISSVMAGEEDRQNLKQVLHLGLKYGFGINAVVCTFICVLARPLVLIYSKDPEVIRLAIPATILYAISVPFYTVIVVMTNYYQATGHKVFTNLITFLDTFLIVSVLGTLLGRHYGVYGVWAAFPLAETAMLVVLFILIWIHLGRMPRSLDDIMLLPEAFDVSEKNRFRRVCTDLNSVSKCAEDVNRFLIAEGVRPEKSLKVSQCVEELGCNSVQWGFSDGKKHSIEVYLYYKQNVWTLRMRDDGNTFDPKKWYDLHKDEKSMDNLGLRIVFSQNPDITYTMTLKLNTIYVEIK